MGTDTQRAIPGPDPDQNSLSLRLPHNPHIKKRAHACRKSFRSVRIFGLAGPSTRRSLFGQTAFDHVETYLVVFSHAGKLWP